MHSGRLWLMVGALSSWSGSALAAPCLALRPTSIEADWSYAGANASSFDTPQGNVRVWYATQGKHTATPEAVTEAGAAAEAALVGYDTLGFRRPRSDAASPCSDNGGDARLDLYLFDFNAADGTIMIESCDDQSPETCAGFMVVENDFATGHYASMAEGFRTVVPHELFHLVQQAYASNDEAWWSEGTAQWATQHVYPDLDDLESFLPAFFAHPERALDFPPVGAAAGISYGAAIWPLFLSERLDLDAPRTVFEALANGSPDVLAATDAALSKRGQDLGAIFGEFARWNAATGQRAGTDGYSTAASYPEVALEPLSEVLPSEVKGTLAGLSARYFAVGGAAPRALSLSGPSGRIGAWFLPLTEDGVVELSAARELPSVADREGIVVVTGLATDRRDVRFTLSVTEAPVDAESPDFSAGGAAGAPANEEPHDAGAAGQAAGGAGPEPAPVEELPPVHHDEDASASTPRAQAHDDGGCTIAPIAPPTVSVLLTGLSALALLFKRRLDRRPSCRN